jgi:hypothetical protein
MVPFFTLGVASYLDAVHDAAISYHAASRRLNPLLGERFGWLHARLAGRLSEALAAPVVYRASCALPGFHIFQWCLAFEQPVCSVHQDLQYEHLDWKPEEQPDFSRPLSFTLAVVLPQTGGGLRVWDVDHAELEGLDAQARRQLVASRPVRYHPYRVGGLVLHSGHKVHQIAQSNGSRRGDERITLQGHGLCCGGVWHLYW